MRLKKIAFYKWVDLKFIFMPDSVLFTSIVFYLWVFFFNCIYAEAWKSLLSGFLVLNCAVLMPKGFPMQGFREASKYYSSLKQWNKRKSPKNWQRKSAICMCVRAKMMVKDVSAVYKMKILEHFTLWGIFGLAVISTFCPPGIFFWAWWY